MEEKIKLLIWADSPTIPTGWGNVVRFNLKNLSRKKYDVAILGINYRGDPHDLPYRIYPPSTMHQEDLYGTLRLQEIVQKEQPDIIWLINDAWILDGMLATIRKIKFQKIPKIVVYFPVDAEEHDPDWYRNFDIVTKAVVYNQFGYDVAKKAAPMIDFDIIGHGVDNNIFKKMFATREEAKKNLFRGEDQKDLWNSVLFLNASRNQPRKRLDITIEAFKLFAEDKKRNEVCLYLHCGVQDAHIDVIKLAKRLDIDDRLILSTLNSGVQSVTFQLLNKIYNACDIGINSGIGEGFGLPSAEHAITGAPQIVGDHSALHSLYEDCGILVPANINYTIDKIMTIGKIISPIDLADAMNKLYLDKNLYEELSKKSVEKFTSKEFTWGYIANKWNELFTSIL